MTITDNDIAALSSGERAQLLQKLISMGTPSQGSAPRWRSRRLLSLLGAAAAGLLVWIVMLGFQLPQRATAEAWRPVWIGFDILELFALVLTLGAAWRARQILVPAALVTGTLFVADAWFDVTLSWGTSLFWSSIASAVFLELPMTAILWLTARRLVNRSIAAVRARLGIADSRLGICELALPEAVAAAPQSPAPALTSVAA